MPDVGDYSELNELRGDIVQPDVQTGTRRNIRVDALDVLVDPTAAELIAANPTLGGGGASAFTVSNTLFVDVDGSDSTGTRERFDKPYALPSVAIAAALSGDTVYIRPGTYVDSFTCVTGVNIKGAGINATYIKPASTNFITHGVSNCIIEDLTIARASGGNAGKVFHCTGTGATTPPTFATLSTGSYLRNVRISNPNAGGTAVATLVLPTYDCIIEATAASGVGIEQVYGGIHNNLEVIAGKYAIRFAQSAVAGAINTYPFSSTRPVIFNTPHLVQTDTTGGHVIQGLVESSTMNQTVTAGVNWYAPRVNGGKLHSACVTTGAPAATSETFRGCLHMFSVGIDGDRWTTYWFDSYANACYWSQQNNDSLTNIMSGVQNCGITGGSVITSGTTKVFTLTANSAINGVTFEADVTKKITYDQWRLTNCVDFESQIATGDGRIGSVRKDLASLVENVNTIIETEPTTDYNLSTATFECWVKLKSTSTGGAFMSLPSSTNNGFYMAVDRATTQIYGGFNPAASASIVQTNCSALFASNTTSGPYSDGWHHVAMTLGGGVQRLWLDGTEKTSGGGVAGAAPAPVSGRFLIGGFNASNAAGQAYDAGFYVDGLITGVRISNVVRYVTGNTYTTATLRKHWIPDADTLGLWSDTTTTPKVWEDQMHNHDAAMPDAFPPPWIYQDYTPS